jgi:hypothetical protein
MAFNKNSLYIESLVSFILDTKPYHSKLTETIEEYQFFDDVNVKFDERLFIKAKISPTWLYNFYSSGNSLYRTMPAKRLVEPSFKQKSFRVGASENVDMANVPYVYDKKALDGAGINKVSIKRANNIVEPLTQSVDYFENHGSFEFHIKQTMDARGEFTPLWKNGIDEGLIRESTAITRKNALDLDNSASNVNQIRNIIDQIRAENDSLLVKDKEVEKQLNLIYQILDEPNLPQTYEELFAAIKANQILEIDYDDFYNRLRKLSSPLFFRTYTDMGSRESGKLAYDNVSSRSLRVRNITPNFEADYEEWSIIAEGDTKYRVVGSTSGLVGYFNAGETFDVSRIKFNTTYITDANPGETLLITPRNKISIHETAPLEAWNIIKTNPLAHSRPVLISENYGYIESDTGVRNAIRLVDTDMLSGDLIFIARDSKSFDFYHSADSTYKGTVIVDAPFNDGKIGLRIVSGKKNKFNAGDKFYASIINPPARAENIDLGFGYDLDPYDDDVSVYENINQAAQNYLKKINFGYDGRFIDFNLNDLKIKIGEGAQDGRQWRISAIPSDEPIVTLKKDKSGPTNAVDLQEATSGILPDPKSDAAPLYSMANDDDPSIDIRLFYAKQFQVSYSDDNFLTSVSLGIVNVGEKFKSDLEDISFTLAAGTKPFIAVSTDSGYTGGDIISFNVKNDNPYLTNLPVSLVASRIPRLDMHSASFYNCIEADWKVKFLSDSDYQVEAYQDNKLVSGYPILASLKTAGVGLLEGNSFKQNSIHFNIITGLGLAKDDVFEFKTFKDKPSFLVYGSVSGFSGFASYDKYYWNGKIGFKINSPTAVAYKNDLAIRQVNTNSWRIDQGTIDLAMTPNCPSVTYILNKANNNYIVWRTDKGYIGTFNNNFFEDDNVKINIRYLEADEVKIDINAADFAFWNAVNTVHIKTQVESQSPKNGDLILVEKTESGSININITPGNSDISKLYPITIDRRFIDLETNQDIPLSNTSPETAILQGWIPFKATHFDSRISKAEFSDVSVKHTFNAIGTNELIGTLRQQENNLNEPIVFEWEKDFFEKYLPLNTQANLVINSDSWDEKVNVQIFESVKFLIDGGALLEDFLFKDAINVKIVPFNEIKVKQNNFDQFNAELKDGPFDGFLAGFGNRPYDEDGYDAGYPRDWFSLLSKANLTVQEQNDVISQWNHYFEGKLPVTKEDFELVRQAILQDPNSDIQTDDFGFPNLGLGIDIVDTNLDPTPAKASIQEAVNMSLNEAGNKHDVNPYDFGKLDLEDEKTAIFYTGSLPPIPTYEFNGETYDEFQTPLETALPARVFEIYFNSSDELNPKFYVWLPTEDAPQFVSVFDKLGKNRFRFSVPKVSLAKIIVG